MTGLMSGLRNFGKIVNRYIRGVILCSAILFGVAAGVSSIGVGVERTFKAWSAALRQHPASGKLHIVEIDARSVAAIDRWPWSRAEHAQVIDRLRAAGATVIAFDVDFSARSGGADDNILAAAIKNADGTVILPTFRQASGSNGQGWTDALPSPALREHAALAAVSVAPDGDGNVREVPIGTITAGTPRPSLSAMIAGRAGQADVTFPVDFAIDPATIPRHSFIDIRDGQFDPATIRGKQVIIGATAVEIGDRYPVPNYGVVPGVVIQALAAETLFAGIPGHLPWPVSLSTASVLGIVILAMRRTVTLAISCIVAPIIVVSLGVMTRAWFGATFAYVPALLPLAIVAVGAVGVQIGAAWQHRRLHDTATGLPNRIALAACLRTAPGAVVVIARITEFDRLEAGLSADAIGQLLHRICDRIRLVSDSVEPHRVGEAMLGWIASIDVESGGETFEKLRMLMLSPVEVDGRRIDVSLSVGLAKHQDKDSMRTIGHAVLASEQAQTDGSGFHLHDSAEAETVDRELSLLSELSDAVLNGDLLVLYQPKLDIAAQRIASVEALVRWQHPTRGYLRPDLFIPLAERNDRIAGLTLFVIERTLRDLNRWAVAGHPLTGAVNISAKLLSSASFKAELLRLISASGVAPSRLTFEVTESAAMTDPAQACAALNLFREIGIAISMDDYGTGQSTLSYLKQLPLNELKIDRSFVQFAHQNRSDAILVRSTIDLAHELGLKVVAEGVEDEACLEFLASVGCDLAQGYLIGKPATAEDIDAMLGQKLLRAA
ncbi:MAG: EAL domain-containing protein [Pseudomonadota bacterium]